MSFFGEYIKNPLTVGAVAPSSRWLARQMLREVDFQNCRCIVEYGPGTGVFSRELQRRKERGTQLLLIEQNPEFSRRLEQEFQRDPSVHVICGSAGDVKQILQKYGFRQVDAVVSGLPFASLPRTVSEEILAQTEQVLGGNGIFITFQYTLFKKKTFQKCFQIRKTFYELRNFPPAFVLVMGRQPSEEKETISGNKGTQLFWSKPAV